VDPLIKSSRTVIFVTVRGFPNFSSNPLISFTFVAKKVYERFRERSRIIADSFTSNVYLEFLLCQSASFFLLNLSSM